MAGSSSGVLFQWGDKEAGTDWCYKSMCYSGLWNRLHDCVLCKSGMKKPFVVNLAGVHVDVQHEHRMVGGKDSNASVDGDGAPGHGHRMPLHLHRDVHYCGEEGWM